MSRIKKRLKVLFFLIITAFVFFSGVIFSNLKHYDKSELPERIVLTWSDTVYSTQSVAWRTKHSVKNGFVQWTPAVDSDEELIDTFMTEASSADHIAGVSLARYHKATMSGLEPEQSYLYRVGEGEHWSEWFKFKTPSNTPKNFSFLYFGDMQNDLRMHCSRVIREAYATCPDAGLLIFGGDMVDHPSDKEWGEWFDCGGWIFSSIPVMAAAGNHDYRQSVSSYLGNYWDCQFSFPLNGPEHFKNSVFYTDYQGVRFIVLDTEGMDAGSKGNFDEQKQWLESVLENNPNHWTILTMHHPMYSNKLNRDNEELRNTFKPVFEKYDIDLVLQGHDHAYTRTGFMSESGNKGPAYLISVTGPKMYSSKLASDNRRIATCTQLFQQIDITDTTLTLSSFTASGVLYDKFILGKNLLGKTIEDHIPADQPERLKLPKLALERYSEQEIADYYKRVDQRLERIARR